MNRAGDVFYESFILLDLIGLEQVLMRPPLTGPAVHAALPLRGNPNAVGIAPAAWHPTQKPFGPLMDPAVHAALPPSGNSNTAGIAARHTTQKPFGPLTGPAMHAALPPSGNPNAAGTIPIVAPASAPPDRNIVEVFGRKVVDPLRKHNYYLPLRLENLVGPLDPPIMPPEPPKLEAIHAGATLVERREHKIKESASQLQHEEWRLACQVLELCHVTSEDPTIENIYNCCRFIHDLGYTPTYKVDPNSDVLGWKEKELKGDKKIDSVVQRRAIVGDRIWLSGPGELTIRKQRDTFVNLTEGHKVKHSTPIDRQQDLHTGCTYCDVRLESSYPVMQITSRAFVKKKLNFKVTHLAMAADPCSSLLMSIAVMINLAVDREIEGFTSQFGISHHCHNTPCINCNHFNIESTPMNNGRRPCAALGKCICGSLDKCFPWATRAVIENLLDTSESRGG